VNAPAKHRGRRLNRSEKRFIGIVLGLAVVHFAFFTVVPVLFSFILSFTDWQMLGTPRFLGLRNYVELASDPIFRIALKNTFLFAIYYVPPMLALSLGLAMFVNQPTRGAGFFKTVYFLPVVTSFVVFALIFRWIFGAEPTSLSNMLVRAVGGAPQSWLQNQHQALPLLAVLGILKGVAWNMVYFLAGLQGIPDVFYEAAKVDGAGRWVTFRRVTLPLLRPTLYFVSVLTTIGAFQVFDSAYLLTQGGPAHATTTIVYFIYTAGFENFRMGYASASAYVLLALVLVMTWIQKRWLGAAADWY
jgi:multiple sugar transport system permease protein